MDKKETLMLKIAKFNIVLGFILGVAIATIGYIGDGTKVEIERMKKEIAAQSK